MDTNTFVYTTYIAVPPEKVWEALTNGEFTKQFWYGREVKSDWKVGSEAIYTMPDGNVNIVSKIRKIDPPKFLEFTFQDVSTASLKGDPESIVTYELEEVKANMKTGAKATSGTKFTVTHYAKSENLFNAVKNGWTMILSGLKTLLETGKPMQI
ncbi:MAG TPA: SRPBCC family protein [Candidatus Kapabacteria bacterium]|nr:SRPBCC family protein [Candidatus Kapabacteria bacterium]